MRNNKKVVNYKRRSCPMCTNFSKHPYLPFCSKRCSMIDLNKWLSESYKVSISENNKLDN